MVEVGQRIGCEFNSPQLGLEIRLRRLQTLLFFLSVQSRTGPISAL